MQATQFPNSSTPRRSGQPAWWQHDEPLYTRADVLRDPRVTPVMWTVYSVLSLHAAAPTGKAWPSIATIARIAGCGTSSVARALINLEHLGYVSRHQRKTGKDGTKNMTTMYRLTAAAPETETPPPRPAGPEPLPFPTKERKAAAARAAAPKTPEEHHAATDEERAAITAHLKAWREAHPGTKRRP